MVWEADIAADRIQSWVYTEEFALASDPALEFATARAQELGAERGVPATAIALAFVLHQQFPTFALFGPRSIGEMRSSTLGLGVELSPQEMAWLDLKAPTR